jgi:hypothetical protein
MQKSKKYDAYWVTRQDTIYNITLTLYNSRLRQDTVRTILYPPLKNRGSRKRTICGSYMGHPIKINTCSASFQYLFNSWKHFKLSCIRHTCLTSSHKWLIPYMTNEKGSHPSWRNCFWRFAILLMSQCPYLAHLCGEHQYDFSQYITSSQFIGSLVSCVTSPTALLQRLPQ